MSGVWATLNAMKARQASAVTTAAKHKSSDSARKAAVSAFESALQAGGSSSDVLARLRNDASVRAVVDTHKSRLRKDGARDEIRAVAKGVRDAASDLAVVAEKVCKANETAHRMAKVGAR